MESEDRIGAARRCEFVYEVEDALSYVNEECRLSSPVEINYLMRNGEGFMRIVSVEDKEEVSDLGNPIKSIVVDKQVTKLASCSLRCSSSDCGVCNGKGGRWDDESQDQWYWCDNCDAADKHYEQARAMRKKQESRASAFAGFFLGWDNNEPPQLWVWRGEPGDETAEAWQKVEF